MFRTNRETTTAPATSPAPAIPLQVRIGIEDTAHDVHDLSSTGFAIGAPSTLAPGTLTHVSFHLAPGLSVSLQARVRHWQAAAERQRFEFSDADRDILTALLLSRDAFAVH